MEFQGYDISAAQALIPKLQRLLHAFRTAGFPVYHTREGTLRSNISKYLPSSNCLQVTGRTSRPSQVGKTSALTTTLPDSVSGRTVHWDGCLSVGNPVTTPSRNFIRS